MLDVKRVNIFLKSEDAINKWIKIFIIKEEINVPSIKEGENDNSVDYKELAVQKQTDVEFGQLAAEKKTQIPGYLPVVIKNCPSSAEVKFFGVETKGKTISGSGVNAVSVEEEENKKIAYFDIRQLVETGHYTEDTAEGVITINNQEVGREPVNTDSAIYLS